MLVQVPVKGLRAGDVLSRGPKVVGVSLGPDPKKRVVRLENDGFRYVVRWGAGTLIQVERPS